MDYNTDQQNLELAEYSELSDPNSGPQRQKLEKETLKSVLTNAPDHLMQDKA